MSQHFIEFHNVCKYYTMGENRIAAADHISFFVDKGEFCVIVGPSGLPAVSLPPLPFLSPRSTCECYKPHKVSCTFTLEVRVRVVKKHGLI